MAATDKNKTGQIQTNPDGTVDYVVDAAGLTSFDELDDEQKKAYAVAGEENKASISDRAVEAMNTMYPNIEWTTPFNEPEPQRKDFELNKEMMDRYFPYMTKEEEDRRARKASNETMWGNWGRAASALANAIAVGQGGAANQEIKPAEGPDIETWRKGIQAYRTQRGQQEIAQDTKYHTAVNTWNQRKLQHENYNKRAMNERNKLMASIYTRLSVEDKADKDRATRYLIAELSRDAALQRAMIQARARRSGGRSGGSSSGKPTTWDKQMDLYAEWAALPESDGTDGSGRYRVKGKTPTPAEMAVQILDYYKAHPDKEPTGQTAQRQTHSNNNSGRGTSGNRGRGGNSSGGSAVSNLGIGKSKK